MVVKVLPQTSAGKDTESPDSSISSFKDGPCSAGQTDKGQYVTYVMFDIFKRLAID